MYGKSWELTGCILKELSKIFKNDPKISSCYFNALIQARACRIHFRFYRIRNSAVSCSRIRHKSFRISKNCLKSNLYLMQSPVSGSLTGSPFSSTRMGPRGRTEEKRTGTNPTAPTVLSKFSTWDKEEIIYNSSLTEKMVKC